MNWLFVTVCLLSSLSGCSMIQNERNELFMAQVPLELNKSLATDASKHLQTLYPPAQTTFNISQPVPNTERFGTALVFDLREKGYAVQEVSPTPSVDAVNGLNLRYTVNKPASRLYAGLYRVQLTVGKAILTRAYTAGNNTAIPAGAWAKME
jgi:type IV secretion system protein TrbH